MICGMLFERLNPVKDGIIWQFARCGAGRLTFHFAAVWELLGYIESHTFSPRSPRSAATEPNPSEV